MSASSAVCRSSVPQRPAAQGEECLASPSAHGGDLHACRFVLKLSLGAWPSGPAWGRARRASPRSFIRRETRFLRVVATGLAGATLVGKRKDEAGGLGCRPRCFREDHPPIVSQGLRALVLGRQMRKSNGQLSANSLSTEAGGQRMGRELAESAWRRVARRKPFRCPK